MDFNQFSIYSSKYKLNTDYALQRAIKSGFSILNCQYFYK